METENAAIIRQIYTAFNERAFDQACALADPQVEVTFVPTEQVFRGQDGFEQFMRSHCAAFPDIRIELRQQIAAGEYVVSEFTGHGTHTGPLVTPNGEIPPTGRSVMIMACEVARLQDGRLTEVHNYQDLAGMLAQLGLMPQPRQAGAVEA